MHDGASGSRGENQLNFILVGPDCVIHLETRDQEWVQANGGALGMLRSGLGTQLHSIIVLVPRFPLHGARAGFSVARASCDCTTCRT